jgi:hypothetical protein
MTDVTEAAGQEPVVRDQVSPAAAESAQQQPAPAVEADGQEPEAEKFDAEYVRKLRREAAETRRKLREYEERVKSYEQEKLTEQEKLQRRLQELEAEAQRLAEERAEMLIRDATTRTAVALGIDPDLAHRIIAVEEIETDDDGRPANIEPLLRAALKRWPHLRGSAQAAPAVAPTNPASPPQQRSGVFTTSQIADRRFWEQHRDEILAALREGRIVEG